MQNELFYCEHITATDEIKYLLENFSVEKETGRGLVDYLRYYAVEEEVSNKMRTYLVREHVTKELVGYFSLKAGMVTQDEKTVLFRREFTSVPGVELANFAVNNSYKERHKEYKGLGEIIFLDFVRPIAKIVSMQIGVRMLYIFALPYSRLVNYYHKQLRFNRLPLLEEYFTHKRIKPRYDRNCIFMYQLIE